MYSTDLARTERVIVPLGGHELLLLFAQLFLLLLVARLLGGAARRVRLPPVVGELLTGIVLGPSMFGSVAPEAFRTVFPGAVGQSHLLEAVSWLGVVMLLVLTGLETDLDRIRRRATSALSVSAAGIAIPFVLGFGLAFALPRRFLPDAPQLVFALFLATAMSISAIPVVARALIDLDALRYDLGQLTLAAAMAVDVAGWILLSVVAGLAHGGGVSVATTGRTILSLALFLGLSLTVVRWIVSGFVSWADLESGGERAKVSTLMLFALGLGACTHLLGFEPILGAFVAGLVLGQVEDFGLDVYRSFEALTLGVFAPVFFGVAGLRVDLAAVLSPDVLLVGLLTLSVAVVGKFAGAYAGAKAVDRTAWESVALGAGLNARGAMGLVVATIGLNLGVLTTEMYAIVVLVDVVTSAMAPPLLRFSLGRVPLGERVAAK
jgi:Kef-type K+ transport system membrane component KefB